MKSSSCALSLCGNFDPYRGTLQSLTCKGLKPSKEVGHRHDHFTIDCPLLLFCNAVKQEPEM